MKLTIVLIALIGMVSAESVSVNGYNVSFNMSRPHEISLDDNDIGIVIKTFDGPVFVNLIENASLDHPAKTIAIDGTYGELSNEETRYFVRYQKNRVGVIISSYMPLYETADFLRSLRISQAPASR